MGHPEEMATAVATLVQGAMQRKEHPPESCESIGLRAIASMVSIELFRQVIGIDALRSQILG